MTTLRHNLRDYGMTISLVLTVFIVPAAYKLAYRRAG